MAAALAAVAARHEALRTRGEERGGRPVGRLEPPPAPRLPVADLGVLAPEPRGAEAARAAAAWMRRRFDLGASPLLRAALLRLGAAEHRLVLATHHFAVDGWSMRVLLGEIAELYPAAAAGRVARLPAPARFADHARRERREAAAGAWDGQLDWWRRRLAGAEPLELPADRPPADHHSGAAPTLRGVTLRWSLPEPLTARLEALGRAAGSTLFTTLLAGLQGLLSRLTGQGDPVVATAVSNRYRPELEGVVGPLSNTLVLRAGLGGDPGFRERVARTAAAAREAFARAELPYDRLVEALRAESPGAEAAARPGLFFVLQSAPLSTYGLPGLEVRFEHVDTGAAKHDLSLSLERTPAGLVGSAELAAERFDATTVRRLLGRLETLLAAAVDDPERPFGLLPLLAAAERHQLLVEGNDSATGYPRGATLGSLFAARAAERPDAVALEWGGGSWSYGELERRSAALAWALAGALGRRGVAPEPRSSGPGSSEPVVGLRLDRGPELVLAMLAVVRAGAAYLPLDPTYPAERLALMTGDAGCALVVDAAGPAPAEAGTARRITLAELAAAAAAGAVAPPPAADPGGLALRPLHLRLDRPAQGGRGDAPREWSAWSRDADYAPARSPATGWRRRSTPSFDAATFEIWGALAAGATLVVRRPRRRPATPPRSPPSVGRRRVTCCS